VFNTHRLARSAKPNQSSMFRCGCCRRRSRSLLTSNCSNAIACC
jgi:hypothetical protein